MNYTLIGRKRGEEISRRVVTAEELSQLFSLSTVSLLLQAAEVASGGIMWRVVPAPSPTKPRRRRRVRAPAS